MALANPKKTLEFPSPVRIDIGGGPTPYHGYLSVDPYCTTAAIPHSAVDIPLADDCVDEAYSSHSLEHFSKYDVPQVLKEVFRVLKSGAIFTIEVPDLVFCVEEWLKAQNNGFELDRIFGLQTGPGQEHKTGFTRDTLAAYLKDAGFEIDSMEIVWSHETSCLSAICRKP